MIQRKRAAIIFLCASFSTIVHADSFEKHIVSVQNAADGIRPDVKKVISISTPDEVCGPVSVQMVYEDSQGDRHAFNYSVMGTGC